MKIIKSARVSKMQLPSIEAMKSHLEENLFKPIGSNDLKAGGFSVNKVTAELVTPIGTGYSFDYRVDERVLPPSAVNQAVAERVESIEKTEGRRVSRKEYQTLKDEMIFSMVPKALVKTTIVQSFYLPEQGFLIVATQSRGMFENVTGALIKAVGSVKMEGIRVSDVKHGLTTRLANVLGGLGPELGFGPFELGGFAQLARTSPAEKVSYDLEDLQDASESIIARINAGFRLSKITLDLRETMRFKLSDDFLLSSIRFDYELEDDEWDAAGLWRHEAATQLLLVLDAINKLADLLGYDEDQQEAISEPVDDPMYPEAVATVKESGAVSITRLQRNLRVGYNRAVHLVQRMEAEGIVTAADENGNRTII